MKVCQAFLQLYSVCVHKKTACTVTHMQLQISYVL